MKIILQKDYPRLGTAHDILTVKDGYARNFLIPEGIAVLATKGNLRQNEEMLKYGAKKADNAVKVAQSLGEKVAAHTVDLKVKVKEGEDIFGSVTVKDLFENLNEAGLEVAKSSILLPEPIKKLGTYDVKIKLHKTVSVTLVVTVENIVPQTKVAEEVVEEVIVEEEVINEEASQTEEA